MAIIDRIKFDGPPDVLAWKWHSDKGVADDIRLGAQLIVNESQEALFFKGGQALDLFGPGTHTLASGNLPLLHRIINFPFGGKTPFTAEVFYINKAVSPAQDWGTKTPIMLLDPRYRVTIPLRGYGSYAVRIVNSREFVVQVVGTSLGATTARPLSSRPSVQSVVGDASGNTVDRAATHLIGAPIIACIQQAFGEYLVERKISALELPAHTLAIGEHVGHLLKSHYKTFGVDLVNFSIESINFDPNDESVRRLRGMLDEAARLDFVGDAFRRNQDFYRTDRQFDVLEAAADNPGSPGQVLGAAMGIGMGFGVAGPAGKLATESMRPESPSQLACAKCGTVYKPGDKFCTACGEKFGGEPVKCRCATCNADNVPTAKFCINCGRQMRIRKCAKCAAILADGANFCPTCGEQA